MYAGESVLCIHKIVWHAFPLHGLISYETVSLHDLNRQYINVYASNSCHCKWQLCIHPVPVLMCMCMYSGACTYNLEN